MILLNLNALLVFSVSLFPSSACCYFCFNRIGMNWLFACIFAKTFHDNVQSLVSCSRDCIFGLSFQPSSNMFIWFVALLCCTVESFQYSNIQPARFTKLIWRHIADLSSSLSHTISASGQTTSNNGGCTPSFTGPNGDIPVFTSGSTVLEGTANGGVPITVGCGEFFDAAIRYLKTATASSQYWAVHTRASTNSSMQYVTTSSTHTMTFPTFLDPQLTGCYASTGDLTTVITYPPTGLGDDYDPWIPVSPSALVSGS